ncbi:MAG: hypothetical protein KF696_15395 [Planctomycetes bacterium]|nr:hypothetical protein [Planctomycetota bacterium]MCW8136057.1 hypothetical protein [Planctomycetota bacterium]
MSKKKKRKHRQTQTAAEPAPQPEPKPDHTLRAPRWLPLLFVVIIAGTVFGAYAGSLGHGYTNWDDNWLITENRHIRGLGWQNIQTMFNPLAPREELGNEYLPVRDLSYAVNYALDGYSPRGFHATNTVLHFLNALLVMLLCWRLTGRRWIGGVAGLLFAVHPVHAESVAWLSSRKDLLATLFMLGSLNLYLAARMGRNHVMPSESFVRRVRHSKRLAYSLALLMFVLALLSKMTAVVLPALLLLIELFRGPSLKSASAPRRAIMLAPFWGVALLFTALASHIGSGLMREPYGDGRLQSWLTATSAIARDFQVLLGAYPLHAAVDLPVQTGLSLPVIVGALLLAGLVAVGFIGWRASRKGEWGAEACMACGAAGFGALWFLVALSPVSNFFVQIGTVFAERYLYIPSIGVCLALATLAVMAVDRLRANLKFRPAVHAAALLLLAAVAGLAAWRTHEAAKPWADSEALWTHALAHDPGNHVAYFNLARELEDRAMSEPDDARRAALLDQAYAQYGHALANPARTYRNDPARVLGAMALNQVHRGNPANALELLEQARQHIDLPWRHQAARNDILALLANPRGLALSALGRHEEALAAFEEALQHSDRYQGARINLASELGRLALRGDPIDEAALNKAYSHLADYERARGRDELSIEARARLRLTEFDRRLALSGRGGDKTVPKDLQPTLDEAKALYRELAELRKRGPGTSSHKAATLVEAADALARASAGDPQAEHYLREALAIKPDYKGLRTLLAQLLFERDTAPARVEANRFLGDELARWPDYRPALVLKAAGLRQTCVNEIVKLRQGWRPEYIAAHKIDTASNPGFEPTVEALIVSFFRRDNFRKALMVCVALMRDAVSTDPENTEGHALIEGTGTDMAVGMWITRDPDMRANAEELLRTGFNARPVDGAISHVLTRFYIELAEQVIARPDSKGDTSRTELNDLLENMLKLSDRARRVLSRKLWDIGINVEQGKTKLRDEAGAELELSELSRRYAAREFIKAATLMNPEHVEALDWLKTFYEEEQQYEEALEVFGKLVTALGERPELMHGVNLALAQLQLNYGQQLLNSFKNTLRLGMDDKARTMRDKAVNAYLSALETTGKLMDNPEDAEKLAMPIRMRGVACQRLAYLLTADAEKYYTIAIEAYERQPLDFIEELAEVRRKRSWFYRDPYKKLDELRQILRQSPEGKDNSHILEDILNLERRIARLEAEALLANSQPQKALERLAEAFKAPTPELYAARGRVYLALARLSDEHANTARAARDLVRATTEPDALLQGAELYWSHEALMHEPDQAVRARVAYAQADEVLAVALAAMPDDAEARARYQRMRDTIRRRMGEIEQLVKVYYTAAKAAWDMGELDNALANALRAHELSGDSPLVLQRLGRIQRALAEKGGPHAQDYANDARGSFVTALGIEHILTSQRLELQLDLASLLVDVMGDRKSARNWLDIAYRTLEFAEGPNTVELRKIYKPQLDALRQRAR